MAEAGARGRQQRQQQAHQQQQHQQAQQQAQQQLQGASAAGAHGGAGGGAGAGADGGAGAGARGIPHLRTQHPPPPGMVFPPRMGLPGVGFHPPPPPPPPPAFFPGSASLFEQLDKRVMVSAKWTAGASNWGTVPYLAVTMYSGESYSPREPVVQPAMQGQFDSLDCTHHACRARKVSHVAFRFLVIDRSAVLVVRRQRIVFSSPVLSCAAMTRRWLTSLSSRPPSVCHTTILKTHQTRVDVDLCWKGASHVIAERLDFVRSLYILQMLHGHVLLHSLPRYFNSAVCED